MNYDKNQDLTIFSALHEAVTAKDNRQLKFAKCNNCGRLTPYRLRGLKDGGLICKKCETPILLSNTK